MMCQVAISHSCLSREVTNLKCRTGCVPRILWKVHQLICQHLGNEVKSSAIPGKSWAFGSGSTQFCTLGKHTTESCIILIFHCLEPGRCCICSARSLASFNMLFTHDGNGFPPSSFQESSHLKKMQCPCLVTFKIRFS